LLWHGSGSEKFIGILSQGLRVGLFEKSTSGMFGSGIYFADMSGKAARYCSGPSGLALMLLCEVEVGHNPLVLKDCDRSAANTLRNEGKVAVIAHGRSSHQGWTNAKMIHRRLDGVRMPDVNSGREHRALMTLAYNEYVVYNPAQVQQRYLFHLKTG
jgi:poly [ADP-ribose] polymerase